MICTEKMYTGKQTVSVCKVELVNMQAFSEVDGTSKQLIGILGILVVISHELYRLVLL